MARTEVVLLPESDGSVGKVAFKGPEGEVVLTRAFEGTSAETGQRAASPSIVDDAVLAERFAALLKFQAESGFGDVGDLRDRLNLPPAAATTEGDGTPDDVGAPPAAQPVLPANGPDSGESPDQPADNEGESGETGESDETGEADDAAADDAGPEDHGEAADHGPPRGFEGRLADLLDDLAAEGDRLRTAHFDRLGFDGALYIFDQDDDEPGEAGGDSTLPEGNDGVLVSGTAADDNQQGGGGDDTLSGSAGADLLQGGGGFDVADYSGSPAGVRVDLGAGAAGGGDATGDTLNSIENLIGSAFSDRLTGDGGQNIIDGRGGADVLDGAGGDDDIVDFRKDPAGVSVDLAGQRATDGSGGNDVVRNFENVFGSEFGDRISGDGGDNTVDARDGADTVTGGNGDDSLDGGGGDDSLDGGSGDDSLDGGGGDDTLIGAQGEDSLEGARGDDSLVGGANDDRLLGGPGADDMTGGAGADTFVFGQLDDGVEVAANQTIAAAGVNTDLINDFTTGVDRIEFDSDEFDNVGLRVVAGSYDGTNSGLGAGGGATFVVDDTHLIYDPDVDQPGFVAIADVDGTLPVLADLNIV